MYHPAEMESYFDMNVYWDDTPEDYAVQRQLK